MTRLHVEPGLGLAEGRLLSLPPGPARHVQVLRLQPGSPVVLFDGSGGEWAAQVWRIGRQEVEVSVGAHHAVERELPVSVTIALGVPANERMDALVEKATELGAAAIVPLATERSVLRLSGERAQRRRLHWAGIAVAASEQCGRTRVPAVSLQQPLADWLDGLPAPDGQERWLLSPGAEPVPAARARSLEPGGALLVLSGPEGGLSESEERAARARGFHALGLGPRVLRADTAPLALLAQLPVLMSGR